MQGPILIIAGANMSVSSISTNTPLKCNYCAKKTQPKTIVKCLEAIYCSPECHIKDWPSHRKFCKHNSPTNQEFLPVDFLTLKILNNTYKTAEARNLFSKNSTNSQDSSSEIMQQEETARANITKTFQKVTSLLKNVVNIEMDIYPKMEILQEQALETDPYIKESNEIFKIFLEIKQLYPSVEMISQLNTNNYDIFTELNDKFIDWLNKSLTFYNKYESKNKTGHRWQCICLFLEIVNPDNKGAGKT